MKIWTQAEADAQRAGLNGFTDMGSGDFTAVDFKGRSRLVIGEGSLLGDDVRLGEFAHIGDHCTFGRNCRIAAFGAVGNRCAFGEGAHLGVACRVGSYTTLRDGCRVDNGTELGDMVSLPDSCTLYGVRAYGDTFIKIAPVEGRALYAFMGLTEDGRETAFVRMPGMVRTLGEFTEFANDLCRMEDAGSGRARQGAEMLAAARYLAARFALI